MPRDYEGLTIDQITYEIIQNIRLICMRHVNYAQFVREVLQAIKSPSTIEEQVTHADLRELRELLIEWRIKSGHDERASQKLRAAIKTALPPWTSKYMEGMPYPGNPFGLCLRIVMAWLYAQLHPPPGSPHPKRMFYEASAAMPAAVTEHWQTDWMSKMERLLPPDAMALPNFQWTCENIFKTETVFRIQPCLWQDFYAQMALLVRDLQTRNRAPNRDGFIFIVSEDINHAMGATIKIRQGYIVCRFFDPNARQAEVAIGLSPSEPESWSAKIFALTHQAGVSLAPNIDCTLVCLCQGPPSRLSITDWRAVEQMSPEKRTICLYTFMRDIGWRGDYLNYICKLMDGIPPEALIGPTILITAAEKGISDVVIRILEMVPSLSHDIAQNLLWPMPDGTTAFYIAADNGWDGVVGIILYMVPKLPPEFAQLLLQPRRDGKTALITAIEKEHNRVIIKILDGVPGLRPNLVQLLLQPMGSLDPLDLAMHRKCPEPIITRLQELKS